MSSGRGWLGLPKMSPEERRKALEDPGPSWREWLTGSFAKTYLGLGFFIADGILVAYWLGPPIAPAGLLASVSVALYLEYLGWQFLWYVPRAWTDASPPLEAGAGPSLEERAAPATLRKLVHPFRFGRWTEAAKRWRSGLAPIPAEGPDPREFL